MTGQSTHIWHKAGYSLIELMITVAIISTLLGIATFAFHDWQVKSNVNAEIRQITADIGDQQVRAATMKQRLSVSINPLNYVFKSYSSDDEALTAGTVTGGTHTVNYPLKRKATTSAVVPCAGEIYEINERGVFGTVWSGTNVDGSNVTIFVDYVGSATLDCLKISSVRVNVGKKDATGVNCNAQ